MKAITILSASLLTAAAVITPAMAHHRHEQSITVSQGWARATAAGQTTGGGFLTITNTSAQPDRLVDVSSTLATNTQVHSMTMDNGIMRMRAVVGGLVIPAHGTLELKPGGYHIMLIGLKHPLRVGERVKLALRFAQAGEVTANLVVEPAGASGPEAHPTMPDMNMTGMDMRHGG